LSCHPTSQRPIYHPGDINPATNNNLLGYTYCFDHCNSVVWGYGLEKPHYKHEKFCKGDLIHIRHQTSIMMYHQPLISTSILLLFIICINISHSSLLPHGSNKRVGSSTPTFIHRGGSTKALDKDAISQLDRQRHHLQSTADGLIQDDTDMSCNNDVNLKASDQEEDTATDNNDGEDTDTQLYVTKRDGRMELLDKNKVCFICIDHEPSYTMLCISFNSLLISLSLLPISLLITSTNRY